MKNLIKKWWFWLIVVIVLVIIVGGQNKKTESNSPYINKYEWNNENSSIHYVEYENGTTMPVHYVVLGVENKDGDLQAGEYKVRVPKEESIFLLTKADKEYKNIEELPAYDIMLPDLDKTEETITLEKGQYLYIEKSSTGNNTGTLTLEKK